MPNIGYETVQRLSSITNALFRRLFYRFRDLHQYEQRKQVTLHSHSNFVAMTFEKSNRKLIALNNIHCRSICYKVLHLLECEQLLIENEDLSVLHTTLQKLFHAALLETAI